LHVAAGRSQTHDLPQQRPVSSQSMPEHAVVDGTHTSSPHELPGPHCFVPHASNAPARKHGDFGSLHAPSVKSHAVPVAQAFALAGRQSSTHAPDRQLLPLPMQVAGEHAALVSASITVESLGTAESMPGSGLDDASLLPQPATAVHEESAKNASARRIIPSGYARDLPSSYSSFFSSFFSSAFSSFLSSSFFFGGASVFQLTLP